jgi:hypothetical protein
MTIHPPVLFTGFSSLAVPFAIAMAGLVKRDYDGWVKVVMPWAALSTGVLATGFIMGGMWAYKVLGWGGYWGWDPVENGSLIPWLCNIALLHGLLVQRATGSLRRTNFFLAITSYVLVLYASFLTRSGVLADFSVHSFVNLGLNGFLLSFLFLVMIVGTARCWSACATSRRRPPARQFLARVHDVARPARVHADVRAGRGRHERSADHAAVRSALQRADVVLQPGQRAAGDRDGPAARRGALDALAAAGDASVPLQRRAPARCRAAGRVDRCHPRRARSYPHGGDVRRGLRTRRQRWW